MNCSIDLCTSFINCLSGGSMNVFRFVFILLWFIIVFPAFSQHRSVKLPNELYEISGMAVKSDHIIWALNDSGNAPVLFEIDASSGKMLKKHPLPVTNRDWEDLQTDPKGNVWIADFGNNQNKRKDLKFYIFNPGSGKIDSLLFRYPDQTAFPPATDADRNFDCEAFVWLNDTLHLFTKSRFAGRHFTKHYTLPAQPGQHTASLRDSLYMKQRTITGAALSHDGQTLALVGYYFVKRKWWLPYTRASVFYFSDFGKTHHLQGKRVQKRLPKFLITRQYESVLQLPDGRWTVANEAILWQKQRLWKL